ncbi:MAG: hypothetical protein ACRDRG_15915 [Pseudonocardiaceae bacterium]
MRPAPELLRRLVAQVRGSVVGANSPNRRPQRAQHPDHGVLARRPGTYPRHPALVEVARNYLRGTAVAPRTAVPIHQALLPAPDPGSVAGVERQRKG